MAMVIKNNLSAQQVLGELTKNSAIESKTFRNVSTGMKINSAADNTSAFSISERMRVRLRSLNQDMMNAQTAASMMKVADGAMSSTVDIMKDLKEKAINAINDTNTDADREIIQREVNQAVDQIDHNADATYNGKILFDHTADSTTEVKETIIKALNSEWIGTGLDMISDGYGLSFTNDGVSCKDMDVKFEDEDNGKLAYVTNTTGPDGKVNKLTLTVNMHSYNNLDITDVNGYDPVSRQTYLDRVIAHEMTHAVMASSIKDFNSMKLYLIEGSAEFTHGIDDERGNVLDSMTKSDFSGIFSSGGASEAKTYAAGYAFLHYLNERGGRGDSMKRFMTQLTTYGASGIDGAVAAASRSGFSSLDEATAGFLSDIDRCGGDMQKFYRDFCGFDTSTAEWDTGSVLGAKGGAGIGADPQNKKNVVVEGKSTDFWYFPQTQIVPIRGLNVDFGEFARPEAGFTYQVGDRANQAVKAKLSDIHATSLGLRSNEDGEAISVRTRGDAKRSLVVIDNALEKLTSQQTSIGSIQLHLDFSIRNLQIQHENEQSSESVIRDSDMASEMLSYTKSHVLMQSTMSMLSQANQNSSDVLGLLQ